MLYHLIWWDDLLAAETDFKPFFGIWKHQLSSYVYGKSVTDCNLFAWNKACFFGKQKAGIVKEGLQQHIRQWMKQSFIQPQSGGEKQYYSSNKKKYMNLSEGTSCEFS